MATESRIHNPKKMKQLIDFRGCDAAGGMYPTDIDGLIEYKDSEYIIFEVKYKDTSVPTGQRLALQRMVDDFTKIGKQAIAMICTHSVKNPGKIIEMARCRVREIYYGDEKRWRSPLVKLTVKEAIDEFQKHSSFLIQNNQTEEEVDYDSCE